MVGPSEDYPPVSTLPPPCDPYIEYCGDNYYEYDYDYSYKKGDLHPIVWFSAFQFGVPMLIFKSLEEAAYQDKYGTQTGYANKSWYTKEVIAWEKIMYVNAAVWGPTFILGIFALSDVLKNITALHIEHMLSNLMWPAYIYSIYQMYNTAVGSEGWSEWIKLLVLFIISSITESAFYSSGTRAMYFLRENYKYADTNLYPSLFYILNWIEH